MKPRLRDKYKNEIIKSLMSKLSLKNLHSVPRIEKVVVNMGLGPDALPLDPSPRAGRRA